MTFLVAAATYNKALFWVGVALLILGLIVQAVMWVSARVQVKAQQGRPHTESVIDELLKILIGFLQKGLYGLGISVLGIVLILIAVGIGG